MKVLTIPTKLILLRILLIPVFLILFFNGLNFAALTVFAVASLSDLFDGVIARVRGQMTDFIKFMDPLADKLLLSSAFIALVATGQIPAWFAIIIVARDFIITGLRLFLASKSVVSGAVITGKFNTTFQMFLVIFILAGASSIVIDIFIGAVLLLTLVSTIQNFVKNWKVIRQIKL